MYVLGGISFHESSLGQGVVGAGLGEGALWHYLLVEEIDLEDFFLLSTTTSVTAAADYVGK